MTRVTLNKPQAELSARSASRRKFLKGATGVAAVAGAAWAIDATAFEPNHPRVVRINIPLGRLPKAFDGLTIAQLSDFHYDKHLLTPFESALQSVNELQPDVIVLTGDFVTVPPFSDYLDTAKQGADAAEPCAAALGKLHANLGMFAVLGNHDLDSDPDRVVNALITRGIPVLRNQSTPLEIDGTRVWITGVDDVLEGKPDLDAALHVVPAAEPVILLAHEPDFADSAAKHPVDLQLSGHSHGGQVRLPLIGAPWLPELARKYPWGLRKVGGLTLYTNAGIGTIRVPVRYHCPPEVTLFTLRSGAPVS